MEFSGHEVRTSHEMGWADLDDRLLLNAMDGRFEVLITVDKSLPRQQRIEDRPFAVVVLRAETNRLEDLLPLAPKLQVLLNELQPGQVRELAK